MGTIIKYKNKQLSVPRGEISLFDEYHNMFTQRALLPIKGPLPERSVPTRIKYTCYCQLTPVFYVHAI